MVFSGNMLPENLFPDAQSRTQAPAFLEPQTFTTAEMLASLGAPAAGGIRSMWPDYEESVTSMNSSRGVGSRACARVYTRAHVRARACARVHAGGALRASVRGRV